MLGPADRHGVERTLAGVRNNYRSFHIAYPVTETECGTCGFDEFTQSALDPSCPECDGIGKTFTWATLEVLGRLQHYDFIKLSAAGIPPGIEVGDLVTYTSGDVKDSILEARASRYGYAYIDGDTYRPFSIQPTGVGHADEWRTEWKRTKVDARATGY